MQFTRKAFFSMFALMGTLGITAATISPSDADSNLSAWLKVLGVENPPANLASVAADQLLFWVSLVFVVISLFGFAEWRLTKAKKPPLPKEEELPGQGSGIAVSGNAKLKMTSAKSYGNRGDGLSLSGQGEADVIDFEASDNGKAND